MVTRRRRELQELAESIRRLPPEEAVPVGRVFLAYVGVQVVLELAVVLVGARAVRRVVRARRSGSPLDPTAAWRSPLVALLVLYRVGRLVSRSLLVRWLRLQLPSTPGR